MPIRRRKCVAQLVEETFYVGYSGPQVRTHFSSLAFALLSLAIFFDSENRGSRVSHVRSVFVPGTAVGNFLHCGSRSLLDLHCSPVEADKATGSEAIDRAKFHRNRRSESPVRCRVLLRMDPLGVSAVPNLFHESSPKSRYRAGSRGSFRTARTITVGSLTPLTKARWNPSRACPLNISQ